MKDEEAYTKYTLTNPEWFAVKTRGVFHSNEIAPSPKLWNRSRIWSY